jgi:hypothetical protein
MAEGPAHVNKGVRSLKILALGPPTKMYGIQAIPFANKHNLK